MRQLWADLHSPRNLIVFDAAARLSSFTRAGEELGMRQPSVSAAIKQLEAALGTQLFVRGHRSVELTSSGKRLYSDVSRALSTIENSVEAVRQMGRSDHVTLSSSSAFSYYWMVPRLSELHSLYPGLDLRLQNSDREPDLDAENIDLAIRLGNGKWPGCLSARIADEVIYPVASPAVMAAAGPLLSVGDLLAQPLIHLEEPVRERPTWAQWFAHHGGAGADLSTGLRLNDYALVLQAAVAGEGFAFGWNHVVRNLLQRGLLTAREDWAWRTGKGFYVVWSRNRVLSQEAKQVRDWMISVSDFPTAVEMDTT